MAHAVETMAYFGQMPWHKLGTVLNENDSFSVEKTIVAAGLNWQVNKVPLFTKEGIEIPNVFGHQRSSDGSILGIATKRYNILQNMEAFNWFQPMLDIGGINFESAGSLNDGKTIWILAKLRGSLTVVGDDSIDKYILLSHSHDGTAAIDAMETGVRVVCANTLAMARKANKTFKSIRHTKSMHMSLAAARDAMVQANAKFEEYVQLYRQLASVKPTVKQVKDYFLAFMNKEGEETAELATKSQNRLDRLFNLFEAGKGQTMTGVKDTMWAAYNAVTEFLSHEAGRNDENRYSNLWFKEDGNRALELALSA